MRRLFWGNCIFMNRKDIFEKILTDISILRFIVKSNVKDCHYDINHECENFYRDLLNDLYDWKLSNLNAKDRNAKGIDLIDEENKIAIQVTSNDSSTKIQDTIKKFEETYSKNDYELYVLNILTKKNYPRAEFKFKDGSEYDLKKYNIDVDDILCAIDNCPIKKMEIISKNVEANLGYYKTFLAKGSSLSETFETKAKKHSTLAGIHDYIDDEIKKDFDALYNDLCSVPTEQRKSVYVFLKKCEEEDNMLLLDPEAFNGFIADASLSKNSINEFISSEKILWFNCTKISCWKTDAFRILKLIKDDSLLERIITGPDFSLLDGKIELSE